MFSLIHSLQPLCGIWDMNVTDFVYSFFYFIFPVTLPAVKNLQEPLKFHPIPSFFSTSIIKDECIKCHSNNVSKTVLTGL